MADAAPPDSPEALAHQREVGRLNKIIRSLMDRAERNTSVQGSDFSLFQTAILLEEQVRKRTAELQAALLENEKINRALRESEAKFRGLVNQSLVGIAIIESDLLSYANAKFAQMFGYGADEIVGLHPLALVPPVDHPKLATLTRQQLQGLTESTDALIRGVRKDGQVIDIELRATAMDIKGRRALIGLVIDVTERLQAERAVLALQEELREQSTHDALTGLFNRRYLEETLQRELIAAQRHGHPISVILGDLDHFKRVNDEHGHLAGDEVLRVFGALMKNLARGSDVYCRYGGEEFLLVSPHMTQASAVGRAEQLRIALAEQLVAYGGQLIRVTASFGVATYPDDGRTGDQLIATADQALYAAKAAGRNRVMAGGSAATPA